MQIVLVLHAFVLCLFALLAPTNLLHYVIYALSFSI